MNSKSDKAWEATLDRALKDLPELAAPSGLVERTMSTLEHAKKPSLLRQPWPMWPLWLRAASLVSMLGLFWVLCGVKWSLARNLLGPRFVQWTDAHVSSFNVVFGALDTVGHAALTVAHHVDSRVVFFGLLTATMAYFACIGLGTAAARLTLARR